MEVSAEAPLSQLLPALVKELGLPQRDPGGQPLVYLLRVGDRTLPEHASLRMLGVRAEEHLKIEAHSTTSSIVPTQRAKQPALAVTHSNEFYSDQTLTDIGVFGATNNPASPNAAYTFDQQAPEHYSFPPIDMMDGKPRRSRRAFLVGGSALLACAGIGLGYAAYRSLSSVTPPPTPGPAVSGPVVSTKPTTAAIPNAALPTRANSLLAFTQHQQTVRTVAWSPDGTQVVSGANDRLLLIWDTTGHVNRRMAQVAAVHAATWSPNGQQLAVAAANQVLFLNALNGKVDARNTHTHKGTVMALAWSKQQPQMLVSAGSDKLAVVWNTQTFQPQVFFRKHGNPIMSATWASDGQTVGTCSTGGVTRIWNGQNGQELHGFFMDGQATTPVLAFEPTGTHLAVGGADGVIRLWANGLTCQVEGQGNTAGQCMDQPRHLQAHTKAIRALAWSPDGRFLASAGDDGQLLIWYPAQSQKPLVKVTQKAAILALSWSPDGKKVATASGRVVTLWELI